MNRTTTRRRLYRTTKRVLDLSGATVGLALSAPLLSTAALAIVATMGRPVLFVQPRIGLHERSFDLFKLRTMRPASDEGEPDADRLTLVGRVLRRASLDELPNLYNVLRGEMSLVGPRPLLPRYLPRYSPHQRRRHEVKPGLTGWAQIHGRNALTWDERLKLDVEYVDRCSLALDLEILARSAVMVLRGSGVSADDHATMPEFRGVNAGMGSST